MKIDFIQAVVKQILSIRIDKHALNLIIGWISYAELWFLS